MSKVGSPTRIVSVCLVVLLSVLVILAVHVAPRLYAPLPGQTEPAFPSTPNASDSLHSKPSPRPHVPLPKGNSVVELLIFVGASVLVLGVVAGLLAFLVSEWWSRSRLGRRWRGLHGGSSRVEPEVPPVPAALSDALDAGLRDLAVGAVDEAIVGCWLRLRTAVADLGLALPDADTPEDMVRRVLGRWSVRSVALEQLAALYREARFSEHRMVEDDRTAARNALESIRAELSVATNG